jgi:hypothetical protein
LDNVENKLILFDWIRTCARGRNLENCAYCNEFACAKLSELLSHEEGAKTKPDEIRTSGRL